MSLILCLFFQISQCVFTTFLMQYHFLHNIFRYACGFPGCSSKTKLGLQTWCSKYAVYKHWEHEHMDSVQRSVQCTDCPKKFVSTYMWQVHMKEYNQKSEEKQFPCPVCGIVKKSVALLKAHEEMHKTGTFSCEFCNYKTYRESLLRSHHR